ncbi:MAG: phosphoenolpyruvate--protein phosphotransferase, partial [Candidatus Omnitrophica bacterium]|nr:phosphoenolpyruvate--protein phosphotransferase [Candidatus Omnitrophota bacterium]
VMKKQIKIFSKIEDEYLRERVNDVNDVGRRVLKNLVDENKLHDLDNLNEELIVVAHDLSPSDTASMYNKNIIAFATDIGGRTSHTAIMAKSLGVPATVGLKEATLRVRNQDFIIVDGRKGLVIIHPTEETRRSYESARERIQQFKNQYEDIKDLPTETTDGHHVKILANLELPEEIPHIHDMGAEGIGLYRTEYFYMNRIDLPNEEEQFEAYKHVAQAMGSKQVTIRTVDLGGDKFISSLQIPRDMYPFLGWRAIRFCLERPDIFKTQLRAILRASSYGNIRIMFPMISGIDEFRKAVQILDESKKSLWDEQVPFNEQIPVGAMIEVPSAALTVDILAKEANFFSIGTNDLIQYSLAVDRVNEQTAALYDPNHPAIIRMIKKVIDDAHQKGVEVGLCGEMCSEPIHALILLGLGLNDFSMSAQNILQIKKLIRSVSLEDARKVAEGVLQLSTSFDIENYARKKLKELAPHIIQPDTSR